VSARVVLFGIGSSIVVEYEETCRRSGVAIVAAVRNRPGATWSNSRHPTLDSDALPPSILRTPCLCPLFTPSNRRSATAEAAAAGFTFAATLLDPTAIVASSSVFGAGGFVNAGCIVGAETRVAEHVVMNRGASIGHHVTIAAFASIGPSAVICGHVNIESDAMIGAGAVILPGVRIGAGAVVAAGAVVVADVGSGMRAFGVAADSRLSADAKA
jgi:sugar O-acyltransferase (sialic acid O-acetyltransferase NeuD family)